MMKTMKFAVLLIGMLFIAGMTARAQEPQGLQIARKQYMRQVKPIQDRYVRSLNMMKQKFIRENDHQAVGAVNQEIELIKERQKMPAAIAAMKQDEDESKYSIAGKCMFYRTPDNKWMKILFFRKDGKILGSNHKNEVGWKQHGKNVSMLDSEGLVTGNYRYIKQDDGHLRYDNVVNGDVIVLLEEPR